ncbi:MAG: hypothetical protein GTN93_10630 [Anaerolineae bacterium]|nr:hypothetical protein [Anaerolineae bacterium]
MNDYRFVGEPGAGSTLIKAESKLEAWMKLYERMLDPGFRHFYLPNGKREIMLGKRRVAYKMVEFTLDAWRPAATDEEIEKMTAGDFYQIDDSTP